MFQSLICCILESIRSESWTVTLQPWANMEGRAASGDVDGRVRPFERQLRVAA
jgi:hypothetical protein